MFCPYTKFTWYLIYLYTFPIFEDHFFVTLILSHVIFQSQKNNFQIPCYPQELGSRAGLKGVWNDLKTLHEWISGVRTR